MTPFYETDRAVSEYLLFHYGRSEEILPYATGPHAALNYPVRCVEHFAGDIGYHQKMRALDLGCAVGRSTFELARHCGEVIGIDYSERFIASAKRLQEEGKIAYSYRDHGDLSLETLAEISSEIDRGRVRFEQGDAMFLREGLGQFDVVLMANLIDRLVDPRRFLNGMGERVVSGGFMILTSPYTWLEDYTPREHWIGGKQETNGAGVRTEDALLELLDPSFERIRVDDLPFLIREHVRKYQWSVAQGSLWRRR